MKSAPRVCPRCGVTNSYRARYTTGGGWRVSHYVCNECRRRHDQHEDSERR